MYKFNTMLKYVSNCDGFSACVTLLGLLYISLTAILLLFLRHFSHDVYTGPNMFGGPMAGPNPGMDMLQMSSPQVGQGMHQQSLNNGGYN